MATQISWGNGKLYRVGSEQLVSGIHYKVHEESSEGPVRWWGELTFDDHVNVRESDRYIIELEDRRKGNCHLKKLVNRAVSGVVPPRYVYHFTGAGELE